MVTGLLAEDRPDRLVLRDPRRTGSSITILKREIEQRTDGGPSIMPAGLLNGLSLAAAVPRPDPLSPRDRRRRPRAGRALTPDPSQVAGLVLPDYEREIDHAGMIADLGPESLGAARRSTTASASTATEPRTRPGSMPTSLRFASGEFKNGSDPYSLYRTLTHGFGQMAPQTWMVPSQKYDVIHYIRETYLKADNPTQYAAVDRAYLDRLPKGTTRGPEPSKIEPWSAMDYGPSADGDLRGGRRRLELRLQGGRGPARRGARRGLARPPLGGFRPRHDAAGGVVDRRRLHRLERDQLQRPARDPSPGSSASHRSPTRSDRAGRTRRRLVPRPAAARSRRSSVWPPAPLLDAFLGAVSPWRPRDPLVHGRRDAGPGDAGRRSLLVGSRLLADRSISAQDERAGRCKSPGHTGASSLLKLETSGVPEMVVFPAPSDWKSPREPQAVQFQGGTRIEVEKPEDFDLTRSDYTIAARFQTRRGGTFFCEAPARAQHGHTDGKSLFVRNGRLVFDIGWVGAGRVDAERWTTASGMKRSTTFEAGDRPGSASISTARPDQRRSILAAEEGPRRPRRSGSASPRPTSPSRVSYFQGQDRRGPLLHAGLSNPKRSPASSKADRA